MKHIKTDICVIGAGSGGLSVAAGAAQMGASVVLLEGHKMGGDCLNYGCVPSKALIAAGKHAHAMRTGAPYGIAAVEPKVDYAAVMDHVADIIKGIEPHDSIERFTELGVNVISEYGRFNSPSEVMAGNTVIKARRFVIATGSSPLVPPIPGLDSVEYLTNENLFKLRERPEHLLVIGGGPIGMEMAQAHARLGSKVTVIEGLHALHHHDPQLSEIALENIRKEGVEVVENEMASKVFGGDGITVKTQNGMEYRGSHLLVAVGRTPNIDNLDLEVAGIETHQTGIVVDKGLRTTNKRVYAIGDVASELQFTHVANYHAGIVIRSALFGMPAKTKENHLPRVTYTDPEIAQVGLTEPQARDAHGDKVEVLRFEFAENDRARTERNTGGFIKVMVLKGKPIGASIVGVQAGELIQTWALVIANGLKINAVAKMVAPYPTIGEINKRVAGQYYSPRLFESERVKRIVRFVQRFL